MTFAQFGIDATFVDPDDPDEFRRALTPRTKAIFAETIGNPQLNVFDIEAVAEVAHGAGVPLVIDNTLASPYLCQPFEHGADIVIHSVTKYLGGHGTTMGGVVVESGTLPVGQRQLPADDRALARLPRRALLRDLRRLRLHDEGAHGDDAHARSDAGAVVRVAAAAGHRDAAAADAAPLRGGDGRSREHLAAHPRVAWVNYPGLRRPGSRYHALARRYLPKGAGGILTFGVKGRREGAASASSRASQFMSHLANVGDAKSLIIHPASTTHRQLYEDEQRAAGVTPDMVRLSIGLESIDDILWDLDQALARAETA